MVRSNIATLAVCCVFSAGAAFSFGVASQLTSFWLHDHDVNDTLIGVVHASYYLGLAIGSVASPELLRRFGTATTLLGAVVHGVCLAAFPNISHIAWWLTLRLAAGVGFAWCILPIETWVGTASAPGRRTRNFGIYAAAITLGGAAGIGLGLARYADRNPEFFRLSGLVAVAAVAALPFAWPRLGGEEQSNDDGSTLPVREVFPSFATAWFQGFLEGGLLAFLALYLESKGLSQEHISVATASMLVGVVAFQVPVGWLADRVGRKPVLAGCYLGVAVTLIAAPRLASPGSVGILCPVFLLLGGAAGAMFPVALAMVGDVVAEAARPRAYAWYLALECGGSLMGAAVLGLSRDWLGEEATFATGLCALLLVVAGWALSAAPAARKDLAKTDPSTPSDARKAEALERPAE